MKDCENCKYASSLSILCQIPQFMLVGLRSFGSALYTTSMSLGNYVSIILVTIVMKITTRNNMFGWIPENLNNGHLEKFYFLLAALTTINFVV